MIEKLGDHLSATSTVRTGDAIVDMRAWSGRATLDVIGAVGFGHDFQCGDSPEARAIKRIWSKTIGDGVKMYGFVAPLIIRILPWIVKLPMKVLKAQGAIRDIVRHIALQIVLNREAAQEEHGKDLISTLFRMKDSQIDLDNLLDQVSACVPLILSSF